MMMKPKHEVVVSYDCNGARKTKTFTDAYAARRFYTAKFKANANPKVESAIDKQ